MESGRRPLFGLFVRALVPPADAPRLDAFAAACLRLLDPFPALLCAAPPPSIALDLGEKQQTAASSTRHTAVLHLRIEVDRWSRCPFVHLSAVAKIKPFPRQLFVAIALIHDCKTKLPAIYSKPLLKTMVSNPMHQSCNRSGSRSVTDVGAIRIDFPLPRSRSPHTHRYASSCLCIRCTMARIKFCI